MLHIHGVEGAFGWDWGIYMIRGGSEEVLGGSRVGVVHIQGMEGVLVPAWCTFRAWRPFFLRSGHIFISQKFAENPRRLPNGRGARSGHGLGVVHWV